MGVAWDVAINPRRASNRSVPVTGKPADQLEHGMPGMREIFRGTLPPLVELSARERNLIKEQAGSNVPLGALI